MQGKRSPIRREARRGALLTALAVATGCSGQIDGSMNGSMNGSGTPGRPGQPAGSGGTGQAGTPSQPGAPGQSGPGQPTALGAAKPPVGGLRMLTRTELGNTLRDLLADNGSVLAKLPEETLDLHGFAFDNFRPANVKPGQNGVRALELLCRDLVSSVMSDPKRRAAVVPCTPSGASDAACMKQFVADFGLRALRRPLHPEEATLYEGFLDVARDTGDFWAGASAAARAVLLNPEVVYRVEAGEPVAGSPGVVKLTGYEVAARLSYTLVGSMPDRMLLEDARGGRLLTPEGRRAAAQRLFGSPAARARMAHFHAFWLGYQGALLAGQSNDPFLEESNALVNDVLFDNKRDYKELFLSKETFVGSALRKHYDDLGAPAASAAGWVTYPDANPARPGGERAGILSHGTFLSARRDGDETSIPRRGTLIHARLLCDPIPDPPPNVNVDLSGLQSTCVTGPKGFYAVTHAEPTCAACHNRLDPVGIGLERFTAAGRYRTHDTEKPQCTIDTSAAKLETPKGPMKFDGPAQLARALVGSGLLEGCVARHAYRFMTGLEEDAGDEPAIADLTQRFGASNRDFVGLWLDLVAANTFALARTND